MMRTLGFKPCQRVRQEREIASTLDRDQPLQRFTSMNDATGTIRNWQAILEDWTPEVRFREVQSVSEALDVIERCLEDLGCPSGLDESGYADNFVSRFLEHNLGNAIKDARQVVDDSPSLD